MSYEFYQGQMSGNLPAWNALLYSKGGWKKSAHLRDGAPIGVDLVGGFYDAGGASNTPMAPPPPPCYHYDATAAVLPDTYCSHLLFNHHRIRFRNRTTTEPLQGSC